MAQLYQSDDETFLKHFREQAIARVKKAQPQLSPDSPEFAKAVAAELAPVQSFADGLYSDLVCLCGCARRDLRGCDCGNAAEEREKALKLMVAYDLFDPAQRTRAYDEITDAFIARHGGQHVLREPKELRGVNKFTQWLPYLALIGALVFIVAVGRRWVARGRAQVRDAASSKVQEADQDYIDALEDELADID